MPEKIINTQFQIPQQQGSFGVYQPDEADPRYAQQVAARLQLQQVYHTDVQSARPVVDADQSVRGGAEHPTFSQIEPFLYEVGDWLAFDRKEVSNNGWIS